jgi:hypothetical protein
VSNDCRDTRDGNSLETIAAGLTALITLIEPNPLLAPRTRIPPYRPGCRCLFCKSIVAGRGSWDSSSAPLDPEIGLLSAETALPREAGSRR